MEFYGIVVVIASVFLILCLILVGILMQNLNPDVSFPPVINPCPDNWAVRGNTCVVPTGKGGNIGILKDNTLNDLDFILKTPGISNTVQSPVFSDPTGQGPTYIDFNNDGWKANGSIAICSQHAWSNQYGITWDGVSNTTSC